MSTANISLTTEERALLTRVLESALGETRVEVHHTHFSPEARAGLIQEEHLLRGLLEKMRSAKT